MLLVVIKPQRNPNLVGGSALRVVVPLYSIRSLKTIPF
jgi:hypothetical protein